MERKLVDGINCVPLDAWVAWGCHEVTKYVPDHSYFQGTGMIIGNLNSWNKLPEDLQKLIMDTMIEYEINQMDFEAKKMAGAKKKMVDAGVEFYKFAPEVKKWFLETAYSSSWAYEEERHGKVVTDFRKLVSQ